MKTSQKQFIRQHRRGSVLILALIVTVVMFIMGLTFISTTQIERDSVASKNEQVDLENGLELVIQRINDVLVQDTVGSNNKILDNDDNDEYYDYPGDNDRWLACLEPQRYPNGNGLIYWPQTSDIYQNDWRIASSPYWVNGPHLYDPIDRTNAVQWDGSADSDPFRFISSEGSRVLCRIVSEEEGTEMIWENGNWNIPGDVFFWGARADADGDGIADSRWTPVLNRDGDMVKGSDGRNLYVAVRIIDNGGMININTALRNPQHSPSLNDADRGLWDGTQLSHINLEDIIAASETSNSNINNFLRLRYGSYGDQLATQFNFDSYALDTKYENWASWRLNNPRWNIIWGSSQDEYLFIEPFDINDELNLRNRFFINAPTSARFAYYDSGGAAVGWPVTFFPGGNVGKDVPYESGDKSITAAHEDLLNSWYNKLKHGIDEGGLIMGIFNRRFFSTTLSYDRAVAPAFEPGDLPAGSLRTAWDNWQTDPCSPGQYHAQLCLNDFVNEKKDPNILAAALYHALPDNTDLVNNEDPCRLPFDRWGDNVLANQEARYHLACQYAANLYDFIDDDNMPTTLADLNDNTYYGFEAEAPQLYISRVAVIFTWVDAGANDGVVQESEVTTEYAVAIHNPVEITDPCYLSNWQLKVIGTDGGELLSESELDKTNVLANPARTPYYDDELVFNDTEEIVLLDRFGRPHDHLTIQNKPTIMDEFKNISPVDGQKYYFCSPMREGYRISRDPCMLAFNTDMPADAWSHSTDDSELKTSPEDEAPNLVGGELPEMPAPLTIHQFNQPITNISQISETFFIGASILRRSSGNLKYVTLPDCWYDMLQDYTDNEINDITAGRIDLGRYFGPDQDNLYTYANILRYLTYFNPFNDGIDNDGNGFSDNPAVDDIDQDGDGIGMPNAEPTLKIDPDERWAYDEYNELAIPGRININTAPWFVIAQLPWLQTPGETVLDNSRLARAIVAYRDKTTVTDTGLGFELDYTTRRIGMGLEVNEFVREKRGFANIGELLNVTHNLDSGHSDYAAASWFNIRQYANDGTNNNASVNDLADPDIINPFYTDSEDKYSDEMAERDIFFKRISNLVTVRSDVFTAYILVRLGENGPQKRVIAIFDRSQVTSENDKPRLLAYYVVPNQR